MFVLFLYSGIVLSRYVFAFMVLGLFKRKKKDIPCSLWTVCFVFGLGVALYGTWVFVKRDFFTYLFLQSEFVFFDYEESKILYYIDCLSVMGLCIFISHYSGKAIRSFKRGERTMKRCFRT